MNAWVFLPPLMGAPWAPQKIGPSMTFVLLVGSQIVFGVLADRWILGLELAWTKWLGASLALLGAVLVAI